MWLSVGNSWSYFGIAKRRRLLTTNERVRIDGVGVEQVVLHAPDDAAEGRDVAAEHAVQVHAAQLVRDAERRAQDAR